MYENTIDKILKYDKITRPKFLGVFARNEIPKDIKYPACYVVNTQARDKPGQHWLALYFDNDGTCDFFDSYGRAPNQYNFINYIKKTAKNYRYNKTRIQGNSNFCGLYCIFFLLFRARNKHKEFIKFFSKNLYKNDDFIFKNIKKYNLK